MYSWDVLGVCHDHGCILMEIAHPATCLTSPVHNLNAPALCSGFGFVTFADPKSAQDVLHSAPHQLDGHEVRDMIPPPPSPPFLFPRGNTAFDTAEAIPRGRYRCGRYVIFHTLRRWLRLLSCVMTCCPILSDERRCKCFAIPCTHSPYLTLMSRFFPAD